jgi:hypothetical protein
MFKIEPLRIDKGPSTTDDKMQENDEQNDDNEFLRLGHEKLVVSCLGIGFTNLTKTLI